ncbi:hypothetical protein AHAS_Ahas03G0252200 [Arachis hypogaea]
MFCIWHIGSNFLRKFKVSYLQKLVVNIGYSRKVESTTSTTRGWKHEARHVLVVQQHRTSQCMSEICKVYRVEFVSLGNTETWPDYLGLTMVANPTLRRTSKGRPKSTRYLKKMDSRKIRDTRVCHLCRKQGHSHSRCPQRVGSSGDGGSGGL